MRSKTTLGGAVALSVFCAASLAGAFGSGAIAQDNLPGESSQEPAEFTEPADFAADQVRFVAEPVVQQLPQSPDEAERASFASSLAELVSETPTDGELSRDMNCLAAAVFFEARGEPLTGQLAVARVVINRTQSGRFPATYCGVVFQKSQFSFVRGGSLPRIDTSSSAWRTAVAVARIAHADLWESDAGDALFFHASYVKPSWGRTRVAQISRHVFYR